MNGKKSLARVVSLSVVALIAGAAYKRELELRSRESANRARIERAEAAIANLRRNLEETRTLGALLNYKPSPQGGAKPVFSADQVDPPAMTDTAPSLQRTEATTSTSAYASFQTVKDGLSARFFEESMDRDWSVVRRPVVEARLRAALPAGARLMSLECRSSMCRAEVEQPDLDAHKAFMQNGFVSNPVPWEGSTTVTSEPIANSNKVTTIAFLAREGQGLSLEDGQANL